MIADGTTVITLTLSGAINRNDDFSRHLGHELALAMCIDLGRLCILDVSQMNNNNGNGTGSTDNQVSCAITGDSSDISGKIDTLRQRMDSGALDVLPSLAGVASSALTVSTYSSNNMGSTGGAMIVGNGATSYAAITLPAVLATIVALVAQ